MVQPEIAYFILDAHPPCELLLFSSSKMKPVMVVFARLKNIKAKEEMLKNNLSYINPFPRLAGSSLLGLCSLI